MATLSEQIHNEGIEAFNAIKEQLCVNVMDGLRNYGHHQIYFNAWKDKNKITLSRYPNGSDCTDIHVSLANHAANFLRNQGLKVELRYFDYDHSPRVLNVSI